MNEQMRGLNQGIGAGPVGTANTSGLSSLYESSGCARNAVLPVSGHGCYIYWTDFSGSISTCVVTGCETKEEAKTKAWDLAKNTGWTKPKWWHWWRWSDTKETD